MKFLIQSLDKKLTYSDKAPYEGKELPPPETFIARSENKSRYFKLFKYTSGKHPVLEYHEYTPDQAD
jgi:hypothetical protein